jgi:SAM-dependent methyltransferase
VSPCPSLLLGLGPRSAFADILQALAGRPVVVLVKPAERADWAGLPTLPMVFRSDDTVQQFRLGCLDPGFLADLRAQRFHSVIIPAWVPTAWRDNALEVLAGHIADTVELIAPDGRNLRGYTGEPLHRLTYNMAYLTSMLTVVPSPAQAGRVLEVGCSDGLACDLLARLGARQVHGVDLWTENVGSVYASEAASFSRSDANRLEFPDQHFDLVYSIATFEHLQDPCRVLAEMHRVTRVGGCLYVQAGPLYHSPFGHHMFAWFADQPWAHLRFTPAQLAGRIRARPAPWPEPSPEAYVASMLSRDHINGLFLDQYRLEAFARERRAEVLMHRISHEGRELLSPELQQDLRAYPADSLVEHGFEFCIRRTS